jgi:hypothetical protein
MSYSLLVPTTEAGGTRFVFSRSCPARKPFAFPSTARNLERFRLRNLNYRKASIDYASPLAVIGKFEEANRFGKAPRSKPEIIS